MNARVEVVLVIAVGVLSGTASLAQPASRHYGLRYDLTLKPATDRAEVSLTVDKRVKHNIRSMRFHIDPVRHDKFEGDGTIDASGEYVTWTPPETGGRLSFQVVVSNRRPNGRFDARMTEDWAIFRGDDLFPPARTEQHDDAEADATLHVRLPDGWSFVAPYRETKDNVYEIEHDHRSFDRPTGWMAAGHLGVRRERIAGVRVVVAGPMNQGVRRLDMLALFNWNLPTRPASRVRTCRTRLLVVSAGDPMFRGGLSGPSSLFIHADRPLLERERLQHVGSRAGTRRHPARGRKRRRLDRGRHRRILFAQADVAVRHAH